MTSAYFSNDYDYLFKLLLIGDSGVGKSSVLSRFSDNEFSNAFISTIGVDFKIKQIDVNNKQAKLQIWDTAGQDRFRAITTSFYRGAHGVMIVFDLTDKDSFKNVKSWLWEIQRYAADDISTILIGNKSDLKNKRAIEYEDAMTMADELGMIYLETSAKEATNIDTAFEELTKQLIKKHNLKPKFNYNSMIRGQKLYDNNSTANVNPNNSTCVCNLL